MKRITVRPYPWQTMERALTIWLLCFGIFLLPLFVAAFVPKADIDLPLRMVFIFLIPVFWLVIIFCVKLLWQKVWGKVILENDKIVWKCLFCKSVEIPLCSIQTVKICETKPENFYRYPPTMGIGRWHMLISDRQFPDPIKRIEKVKCKKGTIRIVVTRQRVDEIRLHLPQPYNRYLQNHTPSRLK